MPELVKKFWTNPSDPPLNLKEISFGYVEQDGKERKYKAEPRSDQLMFHTFVHNLLAAKKKSYNPWPSLNYLKKRVKITDLTAEAVQTELPILSKRRARQVIKKFLK